MSKPKYQIGDKVWRIYQGKAKKEIICGVFASKNGIGYGVDMKNYVYDINCDCNENELFTSKEELIESL